MFKKFSIKIHGKNIIFSEPSVGEYWTMLVDYEQFLLEYFKKYNLDYTKISEENLEKLISEIFEIKEISKNPFENKKEEIKNFAEDFHISVGRFMYAMHLSYQEVCEMPFSIFVKMIEDFAVISGEKEKKEKKSGKIQDLKNLFAMQ